MSAWSVQVKDGRRILYTFDYARADPRRPAEPYRWYQQPVMTDAARLGHAEAMSRAYAELWQPGMDPAQFMRAASTRIGYRNVLPACTGWTALEDIAEPLDIAPGCRPTGIVLAFILDALRAGQRRAVEVDALKDVVRRHGKRIAALSRLTGDQRRHAEDALYQIISQRCPKL